jgi:amidase
MGDVSAAEVLQAALARRDAVNPALNAVVESWDDQARHNADGLTGSLGGVPFLIKDMDGRLAGHRCTFSCRALRDWVPPRSSELMIRFENAGLNIFGSTNCPEFGIMGITEAELRGPARNPWNPQHSPGGSSGGSAAAVAAGIVPMAHGGDGGGSLRIPASHCGIFGLKPSRGLVPLGPDEAEGWDGLVSRGVMSRTVRDTAAALDAVAGTDPGAPYAAPVGPRSYLAVAGRKPPKLRVGFSTRALFGKRMHPEALEAVDKAVSLLADLGHDVIEHDLPIDPDEGARAYMTIVAANVANTVDWVGQVTGRRPTPGDFEHTTWFLKQAGGSLSAAEMSAARSYGNQMNRRFADLFGPQFDVHLTATVARPPVRIKELAPTAVENAGLSLMQRVGLGPVLKRALLDLAEERLAATPQTQMFNMTGQPAASVPMHVTRDGLPIGVQIAARIGEDALLLQLAAQLERAQPWADALPTGGSL